ncbi:MAG: Hint domain-containing protein, partial [Pseudomonadota bacterium]
LVSGWRAELLFGEDEVFVAATHLVNADTIHRAPRRHICYHHLMFDGHEIVLADGVPSESFYPGSHILKDHDLRAEIELIFPEMLNVTCPDWDVARPVIRGAEAKVLCGDMRCAA